MWWDGEDSWVARRIPDLLAAWREGEMPSVTVIGSTWSEEGERTLFIGVEPALDPRPAEWAPGDGPLARLTRTLIQRYGPLPYPEGMESPGEAPAGGVVIRVEPRLSQAMIQLLAIRLRLQRREHDFLKVPIRSADRETRAQLARFELPPETLIGYLGPIRPLTRKGITVFRRPTGNRATAGCFVLTERGPFLTTAGHLGASIGEAVYRLVRTTVLSRKWSQYGHVAAVTSPECPDGSASGRGLDIAAISTNRGPPGEHWHKVTVGDPRHLRRREYVRWNGGRTGQHEGWLDITANAAKALEGDGDLEYEHALMVIGNPPRLGGRDGDSGSAMYDGEGRLLGHLVGTDGARQRGVAPAVWFQMIDVAHPYIEEQCGSILDYYGDGGAKP